MMTWKEEALSGDTIFNSTTLKKSGKVIGNFNFMPVRKTFDAEEVELLEKRLKMSLLLGSFEKEIQNKKAEEAVFQSEKRYHTYGGSPVGIFVWMQWFTTYVNPSWCQISGLFQEALGMVGFNAVHDDDKAAIINGWQNATNEKSISEYRFIALMGKLHGSWDAHPEPTKFRKSDWVMLVPLQILQSVSRLRIEF
jgi:PAS domain-containing protein